MNISLSSLIARADKLQPPPAVLGKLLEIVGTEDYSFADLERVIKADASVAASVLKVANSPYFARSQTVSSLSRAVALLGKTELVRLVVGQAARCMRVDSVPGYELRSGGLWQATIRSAIAGELIAQKTQIVSPGIAYAAGLLLDVGKLAIGEELYRFRAEVMQRGEEFPTESFDELEEHVIGIDHAELGARIAEKWNLPPVIVAAIRFHHQPHLAQQHQGMVYTAHLAASVSMMNGAAAGLDGLRYHMAEDWMDYVVLCVEDLEMIVVQVEREVDKVQELVGREVSS